MNYETIIVQNQDAACIITLNRPKKRNAVSLLMMDEIVSALKLAESDSSIKAVIITGGLSYFSAGADLNEALQVKTTAQGLSYLKQWKRLNATIEELAKPVIASVEGFCITGGLELALTCDIRVGAEGSSYGITSSKIGTVAGAGGTQRLPRIVGMAHALDLLFAANPIDADEAFRIGLINRLCSKGKALEVARALASLYAERAPLSLRLVKKAVHQGMQMDLRSAIEFEALLVTTIYGSKDKQEGISAFLEKRAPSFIGE